MVRTEYRGVDGEELGEGDVGEEREAAAGEEAGAELLGLDLGGEAPHEPRREPPLAAAAARQLRRPRVRRRCHLGRTPARNRGEEGGSQKRAEAEGRTNERN